MFYPRDKINNFLFTRAKTLLKEKEETNLMSDTYSNSVLENNKSKNKDKKNKKPNILNSKLL